MIKVAILDSHEDKGIIACHLQTGEQDGYDNKDYKLVFKYFFKEAENADLIFVDFGELASVTTPGRIYDNYRELLHFLGNHPNKNVYFCLTMNSNFYEDYEDIWAFPNAIQIAYNDSPDKQRNLLKELLQKQRKTRQLKESKAKFKENPPPIDQFLDEHLPTDKNKFELMDSMKAKAIIGNVLLPQQLPALFLAGGYLGIYHSMNSAMSMLRNFVSKYPGSEAYVSRIKELQCYYINSERIDIKYTEIKDRLPETLCFAGNMYLLTAEVFRILNNFLYGKPV